MKLLRRSRCLEDYRSLQDAAPEVDLTSHVPQWATLAQAGRQTTDSRVARHPITPRLLLLAAGLTAIGIYWLPGTLRLAPASRLSSDGLSSGGSERGFADGAAARPDALPSPDTRIDTVAGSGMVVLTPGSPRALLLGEPVPLGVVLTTRVGEPASLRIQRQTAVGLDPGAQVMLRARDLGAGIAVLAGRVSFDVAPPQRAVEIQVATAGAVVTASDASLGVLVASDGRWSTAVQRGSVHVRHDRGTTNVTAGQIAGEHDGAFHVRAMPDALPLAVGSRDAARGWVVRGLTDLLASVTVDDREVSVSANGEFSSEQSPELRQARVTVVDAAGRRAERWVFLASAPSDARPDGSKSAAPMSPGNESKKKTGPKVLPEPTRAAAPSTPPTNGPLSPRRIQW